MTSLDKTLQFLGTEGTVTIPLAKIKELAKNLEGEAYNTILSEVCTDVIDFIVGYRGRLVYEPENIFLDMLKKELENTKRRLHSSYDTFRKPDHTG